MTLSKSKSAETRLIILGIGRCIMERVTAGCSESGMSGDPETAAERVQVQIQVQVHDKWSSSTATAFRLLRNASKTRDTQRASPASAFISTPNGHLTLGDYCAHEMRHEFITLSRGIIWHTNQRPTSSTSTAGEPPASCPNHSSNAFPFTHYSTTTTNEILTYSRLRYSRIITTKSVQQ